MSILYIGSDHAGFELKQMMIERLAPGWEIRDMGTNSPESTDYPLIAHALCAEVAKTGCPGILICGTGTGMSIAANRHREIRAALCANELQAKLARQHNNANVLCLGARLTGSELAFAIIQAFLTSDFEGGRHQRRIDQLAFDE